MSEEEIKAIEDLDLIKEAIDKKYFKTRNSHTIQIIKNLIKKQQKENKKLKEENKKLKDDISNMYDEKVVRNILEECGLSKTEIEEILN